MRHHPRFDILFPMLAGLAVTSAAACGGTVSPDNGASSSGSSSSSGSTSGGSSGASSSSSSSGSTSSGSSGTTVPFETSLCDGTEYLRLKGVTPAPSLVAIDYTELRDEYETTNAQPPNVVAKAGTPCASAVDQPACLTAFAALRSAEGWKKNASGLEPPSHRYLVTTSGDSFAVVKTTDALRDFVSPVDTAKDAALIATAIDQYRVVCDGRNNASKTATGWEIVVQSGDTCGPGTKLEEHVLAVTATGAVTVLKTTLIKEGDPNCAIGRRPEGLVARCEPGRDAASPVGKFFAEAAYLEAASVFAFERLAEELRVFGAPEDLAARALVSRDDEVRHTRMTRALAERFGGQVTDPEVLPSRPRSRLDFALENAVEGCVRESYGALVAHYQARAAGDAAVKRVMDRIALDETRHATLAWDVAAWLEPQLTEGERRQVEAARREAFSDLEAALKTEPSEELTSRAGMPNAETALALFHAFKGEAMAA